MRILRNVFRRKLRAFLTIFGITIGVFALVVMGAMSEKISLLVDGGLRYYGDKVLVTDDAQSQGMLGGTMRASLLRDIERVKGVKRASASLMMMIDDLGGVSMGSPPMIEAEDGRTKGYGSFQVTYKEGRDLERGETGAVVVGSDLVGKLNATLGGWVKVKGERFRVVGILNKTLTAPDTCVVMSMADAQRLYRDDLPTALQAGVQENDLATSIVAYPEPGVDPDVLARRIQREVDGVKASGPSGFQQQIVSSTRIFSAIIFGIALISLIVGGLSVVNTMTMSVAERTREIGVRKAIGATDGAIMRQFVAESAVIGTTGGLLGLALGWLTTTGLNAAGNASGTTLFLLTSRLAIGSVVFAVGLGVVSGLYPAWHAAHLNPVQALRYE